MFEINKERTRALLKWENNWITFMDTILQTYAINLVRWNLFVPSAIEELIVCPKDHLQYINDNKVQSYVNMGANVLR